MVERQLRRMVAAVGLALVAGLGASAQSSAQTGQRRPSFTETACDLPALSSQILPRLRCGTVAVPRDHDNRAAGYFNLAVVVIKSVQQPGLADPVVYINGGPGEPLTIYADYQARHPYAPGRDLILVDQRGTGRSEPRLCPQLNSALLAAGVTIAVERTADNLARRLAVYRACRQQAIARGIVLSDFGTRVTAEDFDWVRQALGIARWNVVG